MSLPHQPPRYGRQLGVAGQVGHQRTDHGAVAGDARLDRDRPRVDPPHHLELLVGHLAGVRVPVPLASDEERGLAGVAVRGLDHQVVAEPRGGRELEQFVVARRSPEHVRDARDARLLAQLRRDDLRVEPVAELGRRAAPRPARRRRLAARSPRRRTRTRPCRAHRVGGRACRRTGQPWVPEQVVADVLDRAELRVRGPRRDEHARMAAVERVEVVDVVEPPHPAIDPEQVERDRRDEVDRRLVGAEEAAQLRDPAQRRRVVRPSFSSVWSRGAILVLAGLDRVICCRDLLPGSSRADALRALGDDVRPGPGVLVASLDEDPADSRRSGSGRSARGACDRRARTTGGRGRRCAQLGGALVPDDHRARPARASLVHALELARLQ